MAKEPSVLRLPANEGWKRGACGQRHSRGDRTSKLHQKAQALEQGQAELAGSYVRAVRGMYRQPGPDGWVQPEKGGGWISRMTRPQAKKCLARLRRSDDSTAQPELVTEYPWNAQTGQGPPGFGSTELRVPTAPTVPDDASRQLPELGVIQEVEATAVKLV